MTSQNRINVYGHVSAQPKTIAALFGASIEEQANPECALAIFAINPAAGIDQATIDLWQVFSEFQTPRLVVVNELEGGESDFDDAILVANRVFDLLVTPYLVLHNDAGDPTALIDLATLEIVDYTQSPVLRRDSDQEHKDLVKDFQSEYLEAVEGAGEGAFEAGLLFPAIPLVISKEIGIDIVATYIDLISDI